MTVGDPEAGRENVGEFLSPLSDTRLALAPISTVNSKHCSQWRAQSLPPIYTNGYHNCNCSLLVDIDPFASQVLPRDLYLLHQLPVCFWHILEGEDTEAELEQKVRAEGNQCPEWKLVRRMLELELLAQLWTGCSTYDGYYFILDFRAERNQVEEAGKVKLVGR